MYTQQNYAALQHYVDELLIDLGYLTRSRVFSRSKSSFRYFYRRCID
jgi:hypothetical protein